MISHLPPWFSGISLFMPHYKSYFGWTHKPEELIVQYLWWSRYIGTTVVTMRELRKRYITVLRSVMCYRLVIITNNTSQEEKKSPCPRPNLKCKYQSYCGRGNGPGWFLSPSTYLLLSTHRWEWQQQWAAHTAMSHASYWGCPRCQAQHKVLTWISQLLFLTTLPDTPYRFPILQVREWSWEELNNSPKDP